MCAQVKTFFGFSLQSNLTQTLRRKSSAAQPCEAVLARDTQPEARFSELSGRAVFEGSAVLLHQTGGGIDMVSNVGFCHHES